MSTGAAMAGGFAEQVMEAQRVFRALMEAMARPAVAVRVETSVAPPEPLSPVTGAVAAALVDADTPVWLDAGLSESHGVRDWLAFHTGATVTGSPVEAHFALVSAPATMPAFDSFAAGTQDYPDRSTTLVLQVATLTEGAPLTFRGPGIDGRATVAPAPLPRHFAGQWEGNRVRFPRGVDLVLATSGAIACLPRTARLCGPEG